MNTSPPKVGSFVSITAGSLGEAMKCEVAYVEAFYAWLKPPDGSNEIAVDWRDWRRV